jgi:hypothetical protein
MSVYSIANNAITGGIEGVSDITGGIEGVKEANWDLWQWGATAGFVVLTAAAAPLAIVSPFALGAGIAGAGAAALGVEGYDKLSEAGIFAAPDRNPLFTVPFNAASAGMDDVSKAAAEAADAARRTIASVTDALSFPSTAFPIGAAVGVVAAIALLFLIRR